MSLCLDRGLEIRSFAEVVANSSLVKLLARECMLLLAILGALLCSMPQAKAQTTSSCYQWGGQTIGGTQMGWFNSPDAAGVRWAELCNMPDKQGDGSCDNQICSPASVAAGATCAFTYTNFVVNSAWPSVLLKYAEHWTYPPTNTSGDRNGNWLPQTRVNPAGCGVYVLAPPEPEAQCGATCNKIGDPINPATGAMYAIEADSNRSGSISFRRFYNSLDSGGGDLSPGWRHSFSRSIAPKYSGSTYKEYLPSSDSSSVYATEAQACTSGFSQIRSRVSTWANATASYADGICSLSVGSTFIGTLPLYYTSTPTPAPGTPILIGLDATRDDGQAVSFKVQGGVISAPPGIAMRLQQTGSGYTLIDTNDNVESYDADGKLLSITSRAGVVQTMGYDTSRRLSTVTDSFGHSITLTYDSQGRLSTVTEQ